MKLSNYNYYLEIEDRKYLVYNAFSNGLAIISNEVKEKIKEKNFNEINPGIIQELKKGGFIVLKDINEFDILKIRYRKAQFNTQNYALTIAPTTDCNMACQYCFETLGEKKKIVMSDQVCDKLIEFIESDLKKGVKRFHVSWFGGEPLLHPEIIENLSSRIIPLCERHKVEYSSSIVTNGTLLNEENIDMLSKNKVREAQITMDGTEMIHNKRRPYYDGSGSFKDIIGNLKHVIKKIPVDLRINVDKKNITEAYDFVSDLTKKEWFDENKIFIYFGHLRKNTDSCKCNEGDVFDNYHYAKESLELSKFLFSKGLKWNFFPSLQVGCGATNLNNFLIGPSGELYKCWNHFGDSSKVVGSIFDNEIQFSSLHLKCLLPGFEDDKECQKCKILPLCMGGCIDMRMRWEEGKSKSKQCADWKYDLKTALYNYYQSTQNKVKGNGGEK